MNAVQSQPWPEVDRHLRSQFVGLRARTEGSVLANLTTVPSKENVHEFEHFKTALGFILRRSRRVWMKKPETYRHDFVS